MVYIRHLVAFIGGEAVRQHLMTAFKYIVAFGVLIWLWKGGQLDFDLISRAFTPEVFGYLFVILFIALCFNFLRFYFIINSQGLGVTAWTAWRVFWMGLFFNYVVPGGTGGDLIKGYYLLKDRPEKKAELIGAIIFDRFAGMYVMMVMALVAMLARPHELEAQSDLKLLFATLLSLWVGLTFASALMMLERARVKLGRKPMLEPMLKWQWLHRMYHLVINLFQIRIFTSACLLTLVCQCLIVYFIRLH